MATREASVAWTSARRDSAVNESPSGAIRSSTDCDVQKTVMNSLLIEVRHDRGLGDVGLVVPVETSVDLCGLTSALYSLDSGDHALLADADRILGNGAHLGAVLDRVDLGLARVIPGYENFAALTRFVDAFNGPFGTPFVRTEDGFEVRVALDHRLADVRRLLNVAAAILLAHDGDVRILGLDLCHEAVSPPIRRLCHPFLIDHACPAA